MNRTTELHNRAMDLVEEAFLARVKGDSDHALELFKQALEAECSAIESMDAIGQIEPTYSVLHRSAATLALDCNEPRLAEKLVSKALSGEPPIEVAEELRDILEQANFLRHLSLRGVELGEDELQVSLAGKAVGLGIVQSDEFIDRVDNTSKIIYRIAERRKKQPFRERGSPKKSVKEDFELFVTTPRAASFAVTLKLGRPAAQQKLPGIQETTAVVDEFMELMDLANKTEIEEIEKRIPDKAYFNNFIGLARKLAPDGKKISQVGFTTLRKSVERTVRITVPRMDFPLKKTDRETEKTGPAEVVGVLRFADATQGESGLIKIINDTEKSIYEVKVPEGMMQDIVRPMWNATVKVVGHHEGKYIVLEDVLELTEKV